MGARLVRDRVGDVDWRFPEAKAGLRPVRDGEEHSWLLLQKLLEEVGEFSVATTPEEIVAEGADVLEVILTWLELAGVAAPHTALTDAANAKREAVGGFTSGVVWET